MISELQAKDVIGSAAGAEPVKECSATSEISEGVLPFRPPAGAWDYGSYYWCVVIPNRKPEPSVNRRSRHKQTDPLGALAQLPVIDVYIHADSVELVGGALVLKGGFRHF